MSRIAARGVAAGVAATLAAGAVGILRQRAEGAAIRRGELQPAPAAADVAPRRPPGRVGDRLAHWVPQPPRHPATRTAAFAWAAPLTAVGWALAGAAGRRPRWHDGYRCWVVDGVRGPSAAALRLVGAEANAVGHVVLSRRVAPSEVLLAHEAVHVRQAERLGPLLLPAYVWLAARYGYRDHPLERAARLGARTATATT
ncbi:hypothetical protein FTX61_12135 [Nitriliruptoraceae bacterium ZYF776]|nr:hypothetical protein [Profundirhabdus halotolerans]